MAYKTITTLLAESEVAYTLHEHEPITTVEEAQERFHLATDNLLKTVVFKIKDGDWILAAVCGPDRIHYKKLADALGVKRTTLRPVGPEEVRQRLGFEIGGVGPFPVSADTQILFDENLRQFERIVCGSGKNTVTVEIRFEDLVALVGGQIAPLVRPSLT